MAEAGGTFPSCYEPGMAFIRTTLILALGAATLAGCARDAQSYPSLARRPIERTSADRPVAPASEAPPAPLTAEVLAQADSLLAQAEAADRRFRQLQASASRTVNAAAGATRGSEAWSVGTVALSQLESSRSDLFMAMASLDELYARSVIERRAVEPLAAVRARVQALIDSENQVIRQLGSQLR